MQPQRPVVTRQMSSAEDVENEIVKIENQILRNEGDKRDQENLMNSLVVWKGREAKLRADLQARQAAKAELRADLKVQALSRQADAEKEKARAETQKAQSMKKAMDKQSTCLLM